MDYFNNNIEELIKTIKQLEHEGNLIEKVKFSNQNLTTKEYLDLITNIIQLLELLYERPIHTNYIEVVAIYRNVEQER